jgi:hypothetical protein
VRAVAIFARVYVSDIDEGIALFADDATRQLRLRMSRPSGLEVALVGDVLILAGPSDVVDAVRSTDVTVIVDDLDAAIAEATRAGGTVVRDETRDSAGRNIKFSYPCGVEIEHVEWSPDLRTRAGL